jgi:hypothetical protein
LTRRARIRYSRRMKALLSSLVLFLAAVAVHAQPAYGAWWTTSYSLKNTAKPAGALTIDFSEAVDDKGTVTFNVYRNEAGSHTTFSGTYERISASIITFSATGPGNSTWTGTVNFKTLQIAGKWKTPATDLSSTTASGKFQAAPQ